jgi:hypothetical protein
MPPTVLLPTDFLPSRNEEEWALPLLAALADLSAITIADPADPSPLRFQEARDMLVRRCEDRRDQIAVIGDGYIGVGEALNVNDVEIVIEAMGGRRDEVRQHVAAPIANAPNATEKGSVISITSRTAGGQTANASGLSVAAGPYPHSINRFLTQPTQSFSPLPGSPHSTVINTPSSNQSVADPEIPDLQMSPMYPDTATPHPPPSSIHGLSVDSSSTHVRPQTPAYQPEDGTNWSNTGVNAPHYQMSDPFSLMHAPQPPIPAPPTPTFANRYPSFSPMQAHHPLYPRCAAPVYARMAPASVESPSLGAVEIWAMAHQRPAAAPTRPASLRYSPPGPTYNTSGPRFDPVAARARLGSPGWSPTSPTFHPAALHDPVRPASLAARPTTPIVRPAAVLVRTSSPAVRPTSPERPAPPVTRPTSVHGRAMAIPRRIVERDRRYRNLQTELDGTEFQAQSKELRAKIHTLKRAMYDIEDEREDEEEERKRARRE